jgi:hypothetical protein
VTWERKVWMVGKVVREEKVVRKEKVVRDSEEQGPKA